MGNYDCTTKKKSNFNFLFSIHRKWFSVLMLWVVGICSVKDVLALRLLCSILKS